MPRTELPTKVKHRIVDGFLSTAGQELKIKKTWVSLDPTFEIGSILKHGSLGERVSLRELK